MPADQHRLFVAVDPSPPVATRLHALRDDALSARWIEPAHFHLTLKFIGNVDTPRRDLIAAKLAEIDAEAPEVHLKQLAVFPSWRRPSVLVVLAETNDVLTRLFRDVEKLLQDAGIPPESRPFTPHVTLARLKGARPEEVRSFVRERHLPQVERFHARRFILYESRLRPSGAAYTPIATYPLAASN